MSTALSTTSPASRPQLSSGSSRAELRAALPHVLVAFITSRLVVALSGGIGIARLIAAEPERGKGLLTEAALMWDGAWYWRVAEQGYYAWNPGTGSNLAFCPLYPLLVRGLTALLDLLGLHAGDPVYGNFVLAGLLISNACFLGALSLLWLLLRLDYSVGIVVLVLLLVALFPAGLFWSAIYTESLFILLSVGALLAARRGIWWAAALLAGLAAVTRWAGVLLIPVLLLEYISQKNVQIAWPRVAAWPSRLIAAMDRRVLWLGLAPLPLLGYMIWLGANFGDPFVFLQAEHLGWQHETAFFPLTYLDSWTMLLQTWTGTAPVQPDPILHWGNGQWLYMLQDLLFIALFVALGIIGAVKRLLRPSYLLWLALGIIFPLSTGTTLAMTRYLLPLFPAFVVLAMLLDKRRPLAALWLAASTALLAITTYYWASGHWMG